MLRTRRIYRPWSRLYHDHQHGNDASSRSTDDNLLSQSLPSPLLTVHDGIVYHTLRGILYAFMHLREVRRDGSTMGCYWDLSHYCMEGTVILVADFVHYR
jgi:hypothetical protein